MTKQILVIDDATTVRLYHHHLLSLAGWQVDEAVNGVDALEKLVSRHPAPPFDLYVVDVNMPRMDGYRFVRELRRRPEAVPAPVLMVTSEAQPQDRLAAFDAGANAYLIKPVQPRALLLTAALLLGDRQAALRGAATALGAGGLA